MTKQYIKEVSRCDECPNFVEREFSPSFCKKLNITVFGDSVDPACPLPDVAPVKATGENK